MWTVMLICVNRVLDPCIWFDWARGTVLQPYADQIIIIFSRVQLLFVFIFMFNSSTLRPHTKLTQISYYPNPPPPVYKYRWRFDNSLSNFKTAIFVSFHLMCGYRYNTIHSLCVSFSHSYLQQDCPNGRLTPAKFVDMYKMFFPSGNAEEFCDHVFRTFDMDKNGYIDFKVG